jgi:hypothetical protein
MAPHKMKGTKCVSCLEYVADFDSFLANHMKYATQGQGCMSYLSNTTCGEFVR